MSAPNERPTCTPQMQAWVDRQMARFTTEDVKPIVRMLLAYERADRERAARGAAA